MEGYGSGGGVEEARRNGIEKGIVEKQSKKVGKKVGNGGEC